MSRSFWWLPLVFTVVGRRKRLETPAPVLPKTAAG
jgi:hypothetical protein